MKFLKIKSRTWSAWFLLLIISCFLLAAEESSPGNIQKFSRERIDSIAAEAVKEISTDLPKWLNKSGIPGCAIAIVNEKDTLWQYEYGFTTKKKEMAVDAETLFSIQSMSKSFTALGVLMAVQDGILDLDTPVNIYLPGFTVNSPYEEHPEKKMTLAHLLSHRAGFTHEAPLGGNFDSRPHTFEEHIKSISATWLKFPVGYRYFYSNLGIDLAGYILQVKTGKPFALYLLEKVFGPLGMNSSTCDMKKIKKSKNRAIGHLAWNAKVPGGIPVEIPMIPAGGVYTNTLDMAKYLRFQINKGVVNGKQLLSRNLIDRMHRVAFPEKTQRSGYGLCLSTGVISKTYSISHGGGGYGFTTLMHMYPELKLGIVILSNTSGVNLFFKTGKVIDEIIEKELGKTEPLPGHLSTGKLTPLSPGDTSVKKILGTYDKTWTIKFKDKVLGISTDGKDFYPLKMFLDKGQIVGRFGKYSEIRFLPPLKNRPGTMVYLNRLKDSVSYLNFHKYEGAADKAGPSKPGWQKYTGEYKTKLWGRKEANTYKVAIINGYLHLDWMRCYEYLPGLFFTYNGEALDFRGKVPTYRNIILQR